MILVGVTCKNMFDEYVLSFDDKLFALVYNNR